MDRQILTFSCSNENYAVDVARVVEVSRFGGAARIPNAAPAVIGVVNLRGQIIPIVDMARVLDGGATEPPKWQVVVFVTVTTQGRARMVGLLVDSVNDVEDLPAEGLLPPPDTSAGGEQFVEGLYYVDGHATVVLDIEAVVGEMAEAKTSPAAEAAAL